MTAHDLTGDLLDDILGFAEEAHESLGEASLAFMHQDQLCATELLGDDAEPRRRFNLAMGQAVRDLLCIIERIERARKSAAPRGTTLEAAAEE